MKRDIAMIRSVLTAVEDGTEYFDGDVEQLGGGVSQEFLEHAQLCIDAGLLCADVSRTDGDGGPILWINYGRLTSAGQDFVCATRDPAIFARVIEQLAKLNGYVLEEVVPLALRLRPEIRERAALNLLNGGQVMGQHL